MNGFQGMGGFPGMGGFQGMNAPQGMNATPQEQSSAEIVVKGLLVEVLTFIDAARTDLALKAIRECDAQIKALSAVQQSKIAMFWNGGVMGMTNMLAQMPENVMATQAATMLPMIRTHVLNSIAQFPYTNEETAYMTDMARAKLTCLEAAAAQAEEEEEEEEEEYEVEPMLSIEEIMANDSFSIEDKIVNLGYVVYVNEDGEEASEDLIDQMGDYIDDFGWFMCLRVPDAYDQTFCGGSFSEFMGSRNERMDLMCQLIRQAEADPTVEKDLWFQRAVRIAYAWENRPMEYPSALQRARFATDWEYERALSHKVLDLYQYVNDLYFMRRRQVEATMPWSDNFVNIGQQYDLLEQFVEADCPNLDTSILPSEWLNYADDEAVMRREMQMARDYVEYKYQMLCMSAELGTLGMFDFKKKSELKTRIKQVEQTLQAIVHAKYHLQ